ncbi:hypothetical protein V1520DRAFT_358217 [Lipomyces starkeyi]|uniref:Uncharacterized protein n=1 Tax=Lipomyces starkeyi NRRL Y-11557 TaxID=675824 RepID=A0A1E3Q1G2_LIPST|nr:hypothetical protein LIPSTDRAFT_163588 [Lipomyces starkeyi NRRL Y-11557]
MNALSAIDDDITVDQMDAQALQADNVAKGIIIGHVSNLMMLTLTMFERASDMYAYLKERYTAKAADLQAELVSKLYSTKMSNSWGKSKRTLRQCYSSANNCNWATPILRTDMRNSTSYENIHFSVTLL